MLRNDLPPIVIPTERRTEYFDMLAGSDVPALTAFFQELSCEEQLRISSFALECEVPEEEPEQEI